MLTDVCRIVMSLLDARTILQILVDLCLGLAGWLGGWVSGRVSGWLVGWLATGAGCWASLSMIYCRTQASESWSLWKHILEIWSFDLLNIKGRLNAQIDGLQGSTNWRIPNLVSLAGEVGRFFLHKLIFCVSPASRGIYWLSEAMLC